MLPMFIGSSSEPSSEPRSLWGGSDGGSTMEPIGGGTYSLYSSSLLKIGFKSSYSTTMGTILDTTSSTFLGDSGFCGFLFSTKRD
jgi:hypothetical protein